MINKFDLAKALLNQTQQIADDNSYLLIPNGKTYEPDPNTSYIQEFVLYGPDNGIGLADDSCDLQYGAYQINVNTPKSNEGSKWLGLKIVGVYQTGFARGTELIFNGQKVRTMNSSLSEIEFNDTHDTQVLSIRYSVIN